MKQILFLFALLTSIQANAQGLTCPCDSAYYTQYPYEWQHPLYQANSLIGRCGETDFPFQDDVIGYSVSNKFDGEGNQLSHAIYGHRQGGLFDEHVKWLRGYDGSGRKIFQINQIDNQLVADAWRDSTKDEYTYYLNDSIESLSHLIWDGNGWVYEYRTKYTYNVNDQVDTLLNQDWTVNGWTNTFQKTHNYHASGNLASVTYQGWNGSAWVNNLKEQFTYDPSGNLTEFVSRIWDGTTWEPENRIQSTYNGSNKKLSETHQTWDGNASWVNEEQILNDYTTQGKMILEIRKIWGGNEWVNEYQRQNTYNANGNPTSETYLSWNENSWVNVNQYLFTYNTSGELTAYLHQTGDGSAWVNQDQTLSSYGANGNKTTVTDQIWEGGMWVNEGRTLYSYNGNQTIMFRQIWEPIGLTGIWVDDGQRSHYYSNPQNFITRIDTWGWVDGQWAETSYNASLNCTGVGVEEEALKEETLLYPNPTSGTFSLETVLRSAGAIRIDVYSTLGQLVYSSAENLPAGPFRKHVQLDVPNGIYHLAFTTADGAAIRKFIITR